MFVFYGWQGKARQGGGSGVWKAAWRASRVGDPRPGGWVGGGVANGVANDRVEAVVGEGECLCG